MFLFPHPHKDDVLGTLLSLYMHGSSQSLPTTEEVLICSSDTTAEEVGCRLKILQKFHNVAVQSEPMLARLRKL